MRIAMNSSRAPDPAPVEVSVGGGWEASPDGPREVPMRLARTTGGPASGVAVVDVAFTNATTVARWFAEALGRDSWNGAGAPLRLEVLPGGSRLWRDGLETDEVVPRGATAHWGGDRAGFAGGTGGLTAGIRRPEFSSTSNSLDLVAHEFVHGMTDTILASRPVDGASEAGAASAEAIAVRESISDVLASTVDGDDWQIGEDRFTPAIAGDAARALDQPRFATMAALREAVQARVPIDPYEHASPASYAAVRAAEQLGSRAEIRDVWFDALANHLRHEDGIDAWASHTIRSAEQLRGRDSDTAIAIRDAWRAVGATVPAQQ